MYSVQAGDTFQLIARKTYGTEIEAGRIQRANPGVSEPLIAGTVLILPPLPEAPQDRTPDAPASNPSEIAVLIEGKRFRFWSSLKVVQSIDSVSTIDLGAPFEPDQTDLREIFRPFTYKSLDVTVGGEPLFTGTVVGVTPVLDTNSNTLAVSGYARPGVLNDCTFPASAFPLEFDGQGLREIAATAADLFGIGVDFTSDQGAIFERVASEASSTVFSFLAGLAKQRNLVMSNTPDGRLLFQKAITVGSPVARLRQGASPVLGVTPSFDPQSYYSHITGLEAVVVGVSGSQHTVKNTRLSGVIRPHTFTAPDTLDADLPTAVAAKMGRMYGGMAGYTLELDTWRDSSGKLWTPNTTLMLGAPRAMIYSDYEFLIRTVELRRDGDAEVATLSLTFPGAFSGQLPEVLPWEG